MIREKSRNKRPSVAIIGAGFGGITTAVKLVEAGFREFTIFEAEDGPGGTWFRNTYPGAEVDVWSSLYSLSFANRNWSRTHATQGELLEYINDIIADHRLGEHFVYGTRVTDAVWDDARHRYDLTFDNREPQSFDVVVAAVGFLSDPNVPDWPGLDEFEGTAFHTQYWDHDVELQGKRIALVGNGSTATQIAPELAPIASELLIFQREPGWILPKGDRDYTSQELAERTPLRRKLERAKLFAKTQWWYVGGNVHHTGSRRNRIAEAKARAYIDSIFADHPELREKVTPKYPFSGKRRILQSTYYPTLLRKNVTLHNAPVEKISPKGVIDINGHEHPVDVLVMATGFKASAYLSTIDVRGRRGRALAEKWRDSAYAFLGLMVDEFPNLYVLYGPNTNGGPILYHHELQADYIVRNLERMQRSGATALEVDETYVTRYNTWLQKRFEGTAWAASNNYMKGPDGRIVTQWADGVISFWLLHKLLRRPSTTASRAKVPS